MKEKIFIGAGRAKELLACREKREMCALSLNKGNEERAFQHSILKYQGEVFGDSDAPKKISEYVKKGYNPEWMLTEAQYQIIVEEKAAYHARMAAFFVGRKRVEYQMRVQIPMEIPCGAVSIDGITQDVHAVTEEKKDAMNYYAAYIFQEGCPKYSKWARRKDRRPEYAPELICAYLGLYKKYSPLRVCIVYLNHEKDRPQEPLKQIQIVEVDFSKETPEELMDRLKESLTAGQIEKGDCENCSLFTTCKVKDIVQIAAEEERPLIEPVKRQQAPKFTPSQKEVVDFEDGTCSVIAVPGAGKTTALVHRMVRLIDQGVEPSRILFVTFTNKAAEEIRTRAEMLLGDGTDLPEVCTFNGLGWAILRDHPEIYGPLRLLTELEQKQLILRCMDEFGEKMKGFNYTYIQGRYGMLRSLIKSFDKLEKESDKEITRLLKDGRDVQQVLQLHQAYKNLLKEEGYIDFDQQITLAVKLLKDNPALLEFYAGKYDYIMADEFQDSSQDNVNLLYLLTNAGKRNLVVVGDVDQSIYEWRDGSPVHLMEFAEKFPGTTVIHMKDNFRSGEEIILLANQLIQKNQNRIAMSMIPHKKGAIPYFLKNQGIAQVPEIVQMLHGKNYEYGDIAVLARTNAPLANVKEALERVGIQAISPSDLLLHDGTFVLIKDVFDLYRHSSDEEYEDFPMYRYLLSQGAEVFYKPNRSASLYENLIDGGLVRVNTKEVDSILEYGVEQDDTGNPYYEAFKRLFQLFLVLDGNIPAPKALEAVCALLHVPEKHPVRLALEERIDQQDIRETGVFTQYLQEMVDLADDGTVDNEVCPEKVSLMTSHKSKGKEFPVVIIIQSEDYEKTEEERRLMYVSMTRAKKVLFILESPGSHCSLIDDLPLNQ